MSEYYVVDGPLAGTMIQLKGNDGYFHFTEDRTTVTYRKLKLANELGRKAFVFALDQESVDNLCSVINALRS